MNWTNNLELKGFTFLPTVPVRHRRWHLLCAGFQPSLLASTWWRHCWACTGSHHSGTQGSGWLLYAELSMRKPVYMPEDIANRQLDVLRKSGSPSSSYLSSHLSEFLAVLLYIEIATRVEPALYKYSHTNLEQRLQMWKSYHKFLLS